MTLLKLIREQKSRAAAPVIPVMTERMIARAQEPKSKVDFEDRHVISPSRISRGMCARQEQILAELEPTKVPASPFLQRKFETGTIVHRWYQNDVFGPAGILYGRWLNLASVGYAKHANGHAGVRPEHEWEIVEGFMPEPEAMLPMTNVRKWFYIEPSIELREWGVGGHCDGLLVMGSTRRILEIKTKNSRLFSALSAPDQDHVAQASLYLSGKMVAHRSSWHQTADSAVILYHNKDTQEEREFSVETPSVPNWIPYEIERLREAEKQRRFADRLPECASMISARAKNCDQCAQCFSSLVYRGKNPIFGGDRG